jgi:hypothetical protein
MVLPASARQSRRDSLQVRIQQGKQIAARDSCLTDVRRLRLHDLPFAYRKVRHGVNFDAELSLTVGDDGLQHALMAATGRMQGYVLRRPDGSALGLLHFLQDEQHARLAYVSPALDEGGAEGLWFDLLDGLAVMAGQRGNVTILAEVNADAREFETLRRAGFAMYTRQTLWERPPGPVEPPEYPLRLAYSHEEPTLLGIYGAVTPGLIKRVEPPPTRADAIYALAGADGLDGMVAVYQGGQAALIEPYLCPDVHAGIGVLLHAGLAAVGAAKRTVYCRAREYMGNLDAALPELGFVQRAAQAAMFRHTAARVTARAADAAAEVIEGGIPLPTSIVGGSEEPEPATPR